MSERTVEEQVGAISEAMWDEIVKRKTRPGICEVEDAEDVAQDTILRVWELIVRGGPISEALMGDPTKKGRDGKCRATVFWIAFKIEGNRRRREALRRHDSTTDEEGEEWPDVRSAPDPAMGPEEEAVLTDLQDWTLSSLSPRQVDAMLGLIRGDTSRETAEDLGISAGTVRKARVVAREKVRLALGLSAIS